MNNSGPWIVLAKAANGRWKRLTTPRGTSRVHRNRDNAVAVASQIPATTGRPAAVIDLEDYALFTSPPADVLMTAEIEFKAHQAATFGVLD